MIRLKTPDEIDTIARAGAILAALYGALPEQVQPGRTTGELDRFAEEFIRAHEGATPAFKGLYNFPATLCVSVNHEVVHGIPSSRRRLAAGDIVSIDCGVQFDGLYADAAVTLPVGEIAPVAQRLLDATQRALAAGVAEVRPGARLGDVGAAIQEIADAGRYGIVRELVGHGVGHAPHEPPEVANHGTRGRGLKLVEGMVLAIEPMLNLGGAAVRTLPDRWTVVTADRKLSAHFEHTVAVVTSGHRILTDGAGRSGLAAGAAT